MTRPSLRDESQGAPGRAAEPPARQCTRCGAVGTHYLTCPDLRLPPGYRLSADLGPDAAEFVERDGTLNHW
jgi:hypothetical protein